MCFGYYCWQFWYSAIGSLKVNKRNSHPRPQSRALQFLLVALAADVAGLLLDVMQGVGGVKNRRPMKMLQIAQMPVARHDQLGAGGERRGEHPIIVGVR